MPEPLDLPPWVECGLDGCQARIRVTRARIYTVSGGRPVYCSREHQHQANWVTLECSGCGATVERLRSRPPGPSGVVMCSTACPGEPPPPSARQIRSRLKTAAAANRDKTARAAPRDVARARAALRSGVFLPQHEQILRARVDHPSEPLSALAARLGLTKDTYAAKLRRALAR